MSGRQLKATSSGNDIVVENGNLVVIEGDSSLAQTLQRRLLTVKGGYRYDLSQGIPYFERIFGKTPDFQVVRALFRRALADHPEVREVKNISFELNKSRQLVNIQILVVATQGVLTLDVPVRVDSDA